MASQTHKFGVYRVLEKSSSYIAVPPGFCVTFFRFLRPKMTDFAAAFLKICGDICGISYCFSVKIYHGQHSLL